jgi:hypothetical protein
MKCHGISGDTSRRLEAGSMKLEAGDKKQEALGRSMKQFGSFYARIDCTDGHKKQELCTIGF